MDDGDPEREGHTNLELRQALERLSLALSATGLGVWERDLATDRVTWSDTMYQLFGRTPEQFSGSPDEVLSFVHPEDRVEFRKGYEVAVRGGGKFFTQEFRIVRQDGQVRWVHRRGRVRRRPDGRAYSVLGVALDITERKQAEEANARLAAIVATADDAIIGLAPDGTILSWNPAAERLFGYPAAEAIGRSARILYPRNSRTDFDNTYVRVRAGEHVRFEASRIRKGGAPIDVSVAITPVIGKEGWVVGASAIVRDVTERKRTDQKLVETLALLMQTNNQRKLALAAGGMGTFEADIEQGTIACSDEIFEQIGIERTSPVMSVTEVEAFIHPDDLESMRARGAAMFQSGPLCQLEFRIIRPDGEVRWIHVRAQAFPSGDTPAKIYGISMDLTERKEREAHIRLLMSEVSHRSKNLLAVVQAIASQTARATTSRADFAADFGARLKGLASSLDLLVQEEWRGVSAKELVRSQLQHYGSLDGERVVMAGPELTLSPLAAQYLGMALHELSTNAAKYGALSGAAGSVNISWSLEGPRNARRFHMSWIESGGPPVVSPRERGFGNLVIERIVAEALHGEVKLEFPPQGLRWFLDADANYARNDAQRP
ncbi:MAG: PAS domain S-box protein [Hyphomicrobiaceae bacterium]|nr:MAG: PAS domain S-box protein [Hyphomicrobiaceae bacterium]